MNCLNCSELYSFALAFQNEAWTFAELRFKLSQSQTRHSHLVVLYRHLVLQDGQSWLYTT